MTAAAAPRRSTAGRLLLALAAASAGCDGGPPDVPLDVNQATSQWLEQLETQVAAGDFRAAAATADKLRTQGYVAADQMNHYLKFAAEAQIGAGQFAEAQETLARLEPGVDDPAELHVLRGRLAAARGNRTLAQGEYAAARRINPKVQIPK